MGGFMETFGTDVDTVGATSAITPYLEHGSWEMLELSPDLAFSMPLRSITVTMRALDCHAREDTVRGIHAMLKKMNKFLEYHALDIIIRCARRAYEHVSSDGSYLTTKTVIDRDDGAVIEFIGCETPHTTTPVETEPDISWEPENVSAKVVYPIPNYGGPTESIAKTDCDDPWDADSHANPLIEAVEVFGVSCGLAYRKAQTFAHHVIFIPYTGRDISEYPLVTYYRKSKHSVSMSDDGIASYSIRTDIYMRSHGNIRTIQRFDDMHIEPPTEWVQIDPPIEKTEVQSTGLRVLFVDSDCEVVSSDDDEREGEDEGDGEWYDADALDVDTFDVRSDGDGCDVDVFFFLY